MLAGTLNITQLSSLNVLTHITQLTIIPIYCREFKLNQENYKVGDCVLVANDDNEDGDSYIAKIQDLIEKGNQQYNNSSFLCPYKSNFTHLYLSFVYSIINI